MTPEIFRQQVANLTAQIAQHPINEHLCEWLNSTFGPQSDMYQQLSATCEAGVHDGWLCTREGGGIRYGRIFKPADDLHGFSVDVVDMESIVGPHHTHPQGEIDLVMPLTEGATFDGHGAGWVVYGPGSQHAPTVSKGRALVMYLLPAGEIQFN